MKERTSNGRFRAGNRAATRRKRSKERLRPSHSELFGYKEVDLGAPPKAPQTRDLPWIQYEEHPEYGLTPARMSDIFLEAETGYLARQCDLFDGLRQADPHLRNLYEQRRGAVSGKPRAWQPGGKGGESELAAAVLDRAMRELPIKAALEHQLTFNEFGFAATEIVWGIKIYEGRAWTVPVQLINVPHRRFVTDPKTDELRLITERERVLGEPLRPGSWWVTIKPGAKIARAGLGRTAAAFAMYKRWGTRDWVIYSEKFGVPLIIVKVPFNAPDELKAVARRIVANIGTDGGAMVEVPEDGDVTVEIKEASKADSTHTSATLIAYCNSENSKLVNGGTLSNDNAGSGGASYGLGNVHMSVRWECVQDDADSIQESQDCSIAKPFLYWNSFAADTTAPALEIEIVEDQEPAAYLANVEKAVSLGVDASKAEIQRRIGAKPPLNDEDSVIKSRVKKAAQDAERAAAAAPKPGETPENQAKSGEKPPKTEDSDEKRAESAPA